MPPDTPPSRPIANGAVQSSLQPPMMHGYKSRTSTKRKDSSVEGISRVNYVDETEDAAEEDGKQEDDDEQADDDEEEEAAKDVEEEEEELVFENDDPHDLDWK
jgi:hypothetical protein